MNAACCVETAFENDANSWGTRWTSRLASGCFPAVVWVQRAFFVVGYMSTRQTRTRAINALVRFFSGLLAHVRPVIVATLDAGGLCMARVAKWLQC